MRNHLTCGDHGVMTAESEKPSDGVRASTAERDAFAETISKASQDGRLSLGEADERMTRIYAVTFREELPEIVRDLPKESWPVDFGRQRATEPAPRGAGEQWGPGLTVHGAIVAVMALGAIAGWIHSGLGFFWPAFPMFWLGLSLFVHYRIRQRWLANWRGGRRGNPADATMPEYRGPFSSNRAA